MPIACPGATAPSHGQTDQSCDRNHLISAESAQLWQLQPKIDFIGATVAKKKLWEKADDGKLSELQAYVFALCLPKNQDDKQSASVWLKFSLSLQTSLSPSQPLQQLPAVGPRKLDLLLLNPHGGISQNLAYLGHHPDIGGQITYVYELALALAQRGHRVGIASRRIGTDNPYFGSCFARSFEMVENATAQPGSMYLLRLDTGKQGFVAKEQLYDELPELTYRLQQFFYPQEKKPLLLGNYADGGYVAALLKEVGWPFATWNAHSLGAVKLDNLLVDHLHEPCLKCAADGLFSRYSFDKRLVAENLAIRGASRLVCNSGMEWDEQYQHPLYAASLQGLANSSHVVAPPGHNQAIFNAKDNTADGLVWQQLQTYIDQLPASRRTLPLVILAGRCVPKKNYGAVVEAFVQVERLHQRANLLLLLGNHPEAIANPTKSPLSPDGREVLQKIHDSLVQRQLLETCCVVPGFENTQHQLAAVYRFCQPPRVRGIFTMMSFYEPFGLMLVEAMACGVPAVGSQYAGPRHILSDDKQMYGLLADPNDPKDIAKALLRLVEDEAYWQTMATKGQKRAQEAFSWANTAKIYEENIQSS